MPLQLRLSLEFAGDLLFRGFLPETEADALRLRQDGYRVTLYLSDRGQQLSNLSDVPTDPEELKRHQSLYCSSLTMQIEVEEPDPDVIAALEGDEPTEKTENFGREIFDLAIDVQRRLVDYFRNILKQYWVQPPNPDPRNYQNYLHRWGAVWLDSSGKWRRFSVVQNFTVHATVSISENGATRQAWARLSSFLAQDKLASMLDVLIANSLQHLHEEDGRLAVVEAVTALESAMKRPLARAIAGLPGAPQVSEDLLNKLFEKAGLRTATEVGLTMTRAAAGLKEDDIQKVFHAIEARNHIIHGPQRTVEIESARKYVLAIKHVIEALKQLGRTQS